MEKTPQEKLKAYVDSQEFSSTTEIMNAMKAMFRDVLQQVMESELDTALGYEKRQRTSDSAVEKKVEIIGMAIQRRQLKHSWEQ